MVIYKYRCAAGHDTLRPSPEAFKPPETVTCDRCQQEAQRRYSVPNVAYIGEGWTGAGAKPRKHGIAR